MEKTLAFTPVELRAIEPYLSDEVLDRSGTAVVATREMILRFGAVLGAEEPVELTLPEREIWLLRELVPLGLRGSDGSALGFILKQKIYNALLELAADEVFARAGLLEMAGGEDRAYGDVKNESEAA